MAVLEIAHPSVCTQHPGKGKYHRVFGAPAGHLQHFALEAAVRAELLAGLEQYLHEGNEGDQLLQAASPWLFLFHREQQIYSLISDGYDTKREKIHLQVVVYKSSNNQEALA